MVGTLQDIRLFVAAYEERSFTAAGQRENATQSGVSQHIRKLEERFRINLFTRDKGRITPTPAGDSYYRCALDVLRAHDAATKVAQTFATGLAGDVVVGLMPTMTRCVLAPALAAFSDAHPNVSLRIVEGYSGTLTKLVQAAELDFAVLPATAGIVGLRSRPYLTTPEVLVGSRAHAGRRSLDPVCARDLGPLRLVVPSRVNTRRMTIDRYFDSNGVKIERLIELDAMLGTLDLVGRSDWVAVLPGIMMAGDAEPENLVINPLSSPALRLDLVVVEPSHRTLSPPADAFLARLFEEGRRLNARWDGAGAGGAR
jgi:DNA-binding transcriptional LysR family regulator